MILTNEIQHKQRYITTISYSKIGTLACDNINESHTRIPILQILVIEFVAFAIEFVPLANEHSVFISMVTDNDVLDTPTAAIFMNNV